MKKTEENVTFTDWEKVDGQLLKKFLEECCFYLVLNANDTFYYSSGDATSMEVEDLWKVLELYQKYGVSGVDAFMAKLRKQEVLAQLQNEYYKKAKEELKDFVRFEDQ